MPSFVRNLSRPVATALIAFTLFATPLAAQNFRLVLPDASPRAQVTQTVGLTNISIDYGRPGVNSRPIWGALVPFDTVWRAGANINTVFTTTAPLMVGGQPLAAGRYGLFMIPGRDKWTVIFSKEANAWGHFSYAQSEDALRISVAPKTSNMVERLEYTFDDPADKGVTVTLRWEKLAVAFPLTVDRDQVVLDSLKQQLRNLARFFPDAYGQAAGWAMDNTKDLALAEVWTDSSINIQAGFGNLNRKATLADRRGDKAEGDRLRARAATMISNEGEMNLYGYQLLTDKKYDAAIAAFERNTKDHPTSANVWDSLGEAYATKGDKAKARANYQKALAIYTDAANKKRVTDILAGLN